MLIMGLSGGIDPMPPDANYPAVLPAGGNFHDSAAVILCDGEVVAAIEEERLNRVKHTNKLPVNAIKFCLRVAGVSLKEVDRIAYYLTEKTCNSAIMAYLLQHPRARLPLDSRAFLADLLTRYTGQMPTTLEQFHYVEHHYAHAVSAYAVGPFEDALVVTIDGQGEGIAGAAFSGRHGRLTRLSQITENNSLGHYYESAISLLGYGRFDEYKVMALAAYGDPNRFRALLDQVISLQPNGSVTVHVEKLGILSLAYPPRRFDEPLEQVHKDMAAAIQELLERAVFHFITHHRYQVGLKHLCLAGGVAHNSTLVGKIIQSGMFDGVFVQPAAHDAGCALGAALAAHQVISASARFKPISHVYWGSDIGASNTIHDELLRWQTMIAVKQLEDPASETANLLANGTIVGWVQGRSEFGPRALGNRSILADPRYLESRDRINSIVKMREEYRPFAPAVLEECVNDWFDIPQGVNAAFMTFTAPVRETARGSLPAITHVDGTARLQTVSRAINPLFWRLIEQFHKIAGVPVLLNTSFNSNVEPIVDSVEDAVACLLTTGLTHVVIGEFLICKRQAGASGIMEYVVSLPEYVQLIHARRSVGAGGLRDAFRLECIASDTADFPVSKTTFDVLEALDGVRSLGEIVVERDLNAARGDIAKEIWSLWEKRLIRVRPQSL